MKKKSKIKCSKTIKKEKTKRTSIREKQRINKTELKIWFSLFLLSFWEAQLCLANLCFFWKYNFFPFSRSLLEANLCFLRKNFFIFEKHSWASRGNKYVPSWEANLCLSWEHNFIPCKTKYLWKKNFSKT